MASETFGPGDRLVYWSTNLKWVTWTRDAEGAWHPDDNRGVIADDDYVRHQLHSSPSDDGLQLIPAPVRPE